MEVFLAMAFCFVFLNAKRHGRGQTLLEAAVGHCCEADNSLPNFAVCLQDKLKEYEKQIQDLTAKLSAAEKEKCTYELKCGEMEKVRLLQATIHA